MGFYTSMILEADHDTDPKMDGRNTELEKQYDMLDKAGVRQELEDALENIEDMHEGFEFRAEMVPVYEHESDEANLLDKSYFVEYAELSKYMRSADVSLSEAMSNIAFVNGEALNESNLSVVINPNEIVDIAEAVEFIAEAKENGTKMFKSKFDMFNGKKIDRNIAKLEKAIAKETDPVALKQLKKDLKAAKSAKAKFEANKK